MPETIKQVNILDQMKQDYTDYAIYVARCRALPDPRDGCKPVHRKILYCMFKDFRKSSKTVKSAAIVGRVIQAYHPHGDSSVYDAMKPMVNWFEIYKPLLVSQGAFGSISGDGAAQMRYTEAKLSDYAIDCVLGDLNISSSSTDWTPNFDGTIMEPIYLPSTAPNLIINGAFGIGAGLRTCVPRHNITEVIDATIALLKNPNADIVLVPDDCQGCDIVEADFAKISHTGKGNFRVRAKVDITEFHKSPALRVTALPPFVFWDSIQRKIESMVKDNILPQVTEVFNNSQTSTKNVKRENFEVYIQLKKGCDPNYVRSFLFSNTELQKTISVNFEVVYNNAPVLFNYKEYLNTFINFRKERKLRTFSSALSDCKTKVHTYLLYIRALESGEIDNIIKMIRKQKGTDDKVYVDYLVDKLKITPMQARFILNTDIRKLSKGYLAKYKELCAQAQKDAEYYYHLVTHPEEINMILMQELMAIRKKYGEPRRSRIISLSEASGIPEGIFKIIITMKGFIKKVDANDKIGSMRDDKPFTILQADNKDNLILFSRLGKAYKVPVHKIPFSGKNSNGTDLRIVVKKYTGEGICTIMPESVLHGLEEEYKKANQEANIFVLTAGGLFKRLMLSEIFNIPSSGLIYSKVNEGDYINDIICMAPSNQLLIYSKNKVLRIEGSTAPLLTRNARGYTAMTSKYPIDGFTCLYPKATDVIVVTKSGRVNRIPLNVIPISTKARAGNSVIRLNKTDSIQGIYVCSNKDTVLINTMKDTYRIPVKDISVGSSIGAGEKLVDASGVIIATIEKK